MCRWAGRFFAWGMRLSIGRLTAGLPVDLERQMGQVIIDVVIGILVVLVISWFMGVIFGGI